MRVLAASTMTDDDDDDDDDDDGDEEGGVGKEGFVASGVIIAIEMFIVAFRPSD